MARPLFSDMLFERRRQLGLSIKQASNVLRLKEEVLIAFEEGDFDSIPKSGYAQGMLSSYARYLGLNAKTVVNQFTQDLFEHERGAESHEARRNRRRMSRDDDGPLYQTPQASAANQQGMRRTYVASRGFLPTSGGFAGDMGDFATTSPARPRYHASASPDDTGASYTQDRPYTTRVPLTSGMTPLGTAQRQRTRGRGSSAYGADDYVTSGRYAGRDVADVTTRRVTPQQYRDDMRLDNAGVSFEHASSAAGRRRSRNIASTERPNVSRRPRRTTRRQEPQGLMGFFASFFEDRGRTLVLIVSLLALLLTAIIVVSVRSCVSAQQSTGHSVAVSTSDTKEDSSAKDMTDEEEQRARDEAAAAKAAESESSATERTLEVVVADGEVTWLEIEYEGRSDIAETVTGPWDRTYTVRQSITINVNNPSAVTVTEGGKKLEFDSKASGIGTITVQVAKQSDLDVAAAADSQTQDASQQSSTQPTDQTGSTPTDATQAPTQQSDQQSPAATTTSGQGGTGAIPEGYTLDSDGYYYGADGYYDASGNYYSY